MGRSVSRVLRKLCRAAKGTFLAPGEALHAFLQMQKHVFRSQVAKIHGYELGFGTIDLFDVVGTVDEVVEPYAFLEGGSLISDLVLLKGLARKFHPCTYLEIGTWRGESVANVAALGGECISVNLADEETLAQGWSPEFVKVARHFSRHIPNVRHILENSRVADLSAFKNRVDVVFIDGDHSYEGVRSDTALAFELLRNEDSVIVWHDYARSPERDVDWEVVAGILDGAPAAAKPHLYHVSNTLCAIFVNETFNRTYPQFPSTPDKTFKLVVSGQKHC